jgi:hypothetical protein
MSFQPGKEAFGSELELVSMRRSFFCAGDFQARKWNMSGVHHVGSTLRPMNLLNPQPHPDLQLSTSRNLNTRLKPQPGQSSF